MGSSNSKVSPEEDLENKAKEFVDLQKKKYGEIDPFFHEFDYNKDGVLDDKEFRQAIRSYIRVHPEKEKNLSELINNLDIGVNNPIGLEDFRKIMTIYLSDEMNLENMIDVFK
jgi:Ca2+-binding EF-hand superfamily protein